MLRNCVIAVIFALLLLSVGHADPWKITGERYNLTCSAWASGTRWSYLFSVDDPLYDDAIWRLLRHPALRVMLGATDIALDVQEFTETKVKAVLTTPLTDWPAGAVRMTLDISRSNGAVTLTFNGEEHTTPGGMHWSYVIQTATGGCAKAAQAF